MVGGRPQELFEVGERRVEFSEGGAQSTKKTMSQALAAGTVRKAVKVSVAALFAATAMAMAADRADAQAVDPSIAKSDGQVPIYEACFPEDPLLGDIGGGYIPLYNGPVVEGVILLNTCALERLGAEPQEIDSVIVHELGHSRGLLPSDEPANLMYPAYPITGT